MSPELKGVIIGSLISSLVVLLSAVIQSLSARQQRKAEERKHLKELLIKTALESRNQTLEIAKRTPGQSVILPLTDHILHMVALAEIVFEKKLDKATVAARMKELEEFGMTLHAERTRMTLNKH